MPRRRTNASAADGLAHSKGIGARRERELAEEVARRERRDEARRAAHQRDGGVCRRCRYRYETQQTTRRPRPLLLMVNQGDEHRLAHAHEVVPRSVGGDPLDPTNILILCSICHSVVQGTVGGGEEVRLLEPALGLKGRVEFVELNGRSRRESYQQIRVPTRELVGRSRLTGVDFDEELTRIAIEYGNEASAAAEGAPEMRPPWEEDSSDDDDGIPF